MRSVFIPIILLGLLAALPACRTGDRNRSAENLPEAINTDVPTLAVAFYNVENLFDAFDDPATDDEDFTPTGKLKWTDERVEKKLENLAHAIRSMNDNAGPDLLGMAEVENREVLEWLVNDYLPQGAYGIVHSDSPDGRGIDVALLYRKSAMNLVSMKSHGVGLGIGQGPTRDILQATFGKEGGEFTVLVNHWPSRRGGEEKSEPRRLAAAGVAARIIDELYAADPAADIIMMGDFNDEPDNRSITEGLNGREYRGEPFEGFEGRMINLAAPLMHADTIGSYLFQDDWEIIDQILLSRGGLDDRGIVLRDRAQTIFRPDFLRDYHPSQPLHPPRRTFVRGTLYIGGTSDHFPVFARVGWKGKEGV